MMEDWLFDGATVAEEVAEFAHCAEEALDNARSVLERIDPDAPTLVELQAISASAEAVSDALARLEVLRTALIEADRLLDEARAAGQSPRVHLLARSG